MQLLAPARPSWGRKSCFAGQEYWHFVCSPELMTRWAESPDFGSCLARTQARQQPMPLSGTLLL